MFQITKTKENKKVKKGRVILGSFLILVGICLGIYNIYNNNQPTNLDNDIVEVFMQEEEKIANTPKEQKEEVKAVKATTNYIALLEIPSIKLMNGLVDINSVDNNVSKNIEIIKPSDMPDVQNGHLILAAHSGYGKVAYFKNLYKLKIDDEIFIHYNGSKYIYKIFDIYDIEKTGKFNLRSYWNKNVLTLITCRENTNKQIIITTELVKIESKGVY